LNTRIWKFGKHVCKKELVKMKILACENKFERVADMLYNGFNLLKNKFIKYLDRSTLYPVSITLTHSFTPKIFIKWTRTVSAIFSGPCAKMSMPDLQRYL